MKEAKSKQDIRALFHFFSRNIREQLLALPLEADGMEEVRLRVGAPLYYIYKNNEYTAGGGFRVRREDVDETLQCAARSSLYAYGEEIRQGFLTVQGGHRIGVAGKTILENGHIKAIHPITFLNVRFSHQMIGCAAGIRSVLTDPGTGSICNTLLIAPPRCGKTTLLRDLIRMVSDGEVGEDKGLDRAGVLERSEAGGRYGNRSGKTVEMRRWHGGKVRAQTVGVVDERSEIAACYQGIPQNDVGGRTDVLDACPKAEGMMMMIRSMAPEVVAVDEIGGAADLEALRYVMNCGCRILATVHGNSMEDIREKPGLSSFLKEKRFDRYVVLGNQRGPGTVEAVYDAAGERMTFEKGGKKNENDRLGHKSRQEKIQTVVLQSKNGREAENVT